MLKKKTNSVATNRRAAYDYKIGDKFEAGIVLKGSEVKSLRNNRVDISHAFISQENGEIFLKNSSKAFFDADFFSTIFCAKFIASYKFATDLLK